MEPTTPSPAPTTASKKKLFYILGGLVSIAIIAVLTVVVLSMVLKGSKPSDPVAATQPALNDVATSEKLISGYAATRIDTRDASYAKRELVKPSQTTDIQSKDVAPSQGPTNSTVTYTKAGRFAVQVATSDYVQYQRKDASIVTNDDQLVQKTEAFLTAEGLVKTDTTKLADGSSNSTFDSKNVVCQVSNITSVAKQAPTFGLACIAKPVIDTQYTFIDSLTKLVPNFDVKTAKSITSSLPIVQDSMKLQTLTVSTSDKAQNFYFATLGKSWEYLGQRPVTNPDDSASFTLPDELKKAISDPKWNGFLEKYVK